MHTGLVTTLIAGRNRQMADESAIDAVQQTLEAAGARVTRRDWLSPGEACDLLHENLDEAECRSAIASVCVDNLLDQITQPREGRRKQLLISDMDSTIIEQECIDELADAVGIKPQVATITARAMNGELNFEAALKERVALLKGLPEEQLQQVYDSRISYMQGAAELVATMKAHGATCWLVSGGFTFFTKRVAAKLGFDEDRSNTLIIKNGALAGEVAEPILGKEAKVEALMEACNQLGISTREALAIGDGANDLPMLMAAGMGVACHAKPNVQAAAQHAINHTDLRALLFAQGYKKEDIVV